jgi:hypothetical protein
MQSALPLQAVTWDVQVPVWQELQLPPPPVLPPPVLPPPVLPPEVEPFDVEPLDELLEPPPEHPTDASIRTSANLPSLTGYPLG